MQAITVKYIPATNTKPSRLKATCKAGTVTVPFSNQVSETESDAFKRAARTLRDKLHWDSKNYGDMYGGVTRTGDYVFVFAYPDTKL